MCEMMGKKIEEKRYEGRRENRVRSPRQNGGDGAKQPEDADKALLHEDSQTWITVLE